MPEPEIPLPSPERDSYWDPRPLRCPHCRSILQPKGNGMGWCPLHNVIKGVYFETQNLELEVEE